MIAWLRAFWCALVGHRRPPRVTYSTLQAGMRGRTRYVGRAVPRCARCGEVLR